MSWQVLLIQSNRPIQSQPKNWMPTCNHSPKANSPTKMRKSLFSSLKMATNSNQSMSNWIRYALQQAMHFLKRSIMIPLGTWTISYNKCSLKEKRTPKLKRSLGSDSSLQVATIETTRKYLKKRANLSNDWGKTRDSSHSYRNKSMALIIKWKSMLQRMSIGRGMMYPLIWWWGERTKILERLLNTRRPCRELDGLIWWVFRRRWSSLSMDWVRRKRQLVWSDSTETTSRNNHITTCLT